MEESFTFAFQPNCPLEPNPAIADVRKGSAEIWAPLKSPIVALQDIALALGLPPDAVTCHVVQGGGSFGRDLFWDAAKEAALASKAMGKPVKLMYTRTDDFRHGRVHPASRSTIRLAHTDDDIVAYAQHHTSVNTDFGHGFGDLLTAVADELPLGVGGLTFSQIIFLLSQSVPYNFGPVSQTLAETLPRVLEARNNIFRTSSMRNIYSPNVVTARELMIDRAAGTMDRDPLELRLAAARDDRSRAVLERVAEAGDWGRAMPEGTAQGLGFHSEYKGRAACLIEIDCRPDTVARKVPTAEYAYTGPRVTRAIYAVDVGLAINPRGLEAQMIGGMMDGIANALSYSLHLRDGAFAEDSWEHAYYTRQWNTPFETQVFVIPSSDQPGGAGEFGVAATMAATATAYARAPGTMPTRFPINHDEPLAETIVPQGTVPQSPTDGLAGIR
jgi:isoquinoline 1-oxidoreductase beta subunit